MLTSVTAIRFDKAVTSGKTKPGILTCVKDDGSEVELVAKFAAGCEMKHRALVAEAVTAMLGADLDLPVPEPFLVKVEADFAATITDAEVKKRAQASVGWNFGSKKLPPGFGTYPTDKPLPRTLIATAGEILAFDTFIANPDRTAANPNLLFDGREFAIYDHELAFFTEGLLGWKPPWVNGAIQFPKGLPRNVRHVFLEELRGLALDFTRFSGAFETVTPERLEEYRAALPVQWLGDGTTLDGILEYIEQLQEQIEPAIKQLKGALL